MLDWVHGIFKAAPELALFITIALGYLVGKLKIGRFVLGGIAGTLLMGVLIGQLEVELDPHVKTVFFALFIYAVGYQGGPQFFRAISLRSVNQLISAFTMCVVGLGCVLGGAWLFGLDRGTAAGLAAGGLTQSAIIGTAGEAISRLDVSADLKKQMETNLAVGYAICYIIGNLGPIVMVTWFFPMIMRWNVRAEAVKLAASLSGGRPEMEPGQFDAVRRVDTRVYRADRDGTAIGSTVADLDGRLVHAAVESIERDGQAVDVAPDVTIAEGDIIAVTGRIGVLETLPPIIGPEAPPRGGLFITEEHRELILTNRQFVGRSLGDLDERIDPAMRRGVFLTGIQRMGRDLPILPKLVLQRGDELHLTGRPADLDRVQPKIGYKITAAAVTDFIVFGVGMALGILIGLGQIKVAGVPITLGTGGGCLLSGLLFGWLRSVHPRFGALPTGASNFLRDFGLAVFVGAVGLSAAPQALEAVRKDGIALLILGVAVVFIPQLVVFFFSYFVLRIRNPIEALACLVGGRSANPGFAALLDKAGNATPVVAFTVTYAVANVFLTLWGPLVVGIIQKNPAAPTP